MKSLPRAISMLRSVPWRFTAVIFVSGAACMALALGLALLYAWHTPPGRMPDREPEDNAELLLERAQHFQEALQQSLADRERLVESMHAIQARNPDYTVDFLILSGGGDMGAFASGFLRGWSKAPPGPLARPVFEGVSGVSTGGFIAPAAFLGTTNDDEAIDAVFRSPKPDWVMPRGMLFFHPDNASLAHIPGLEREINAYIDLPFAQRIVDAGASGRQLLIQATDADEAASHRFDCVAIARKAVQTGDIEPLRHVLLATSAVPGVFAPQLIEDDLLVDGVLTGNIFYGFYDGVLGKGETFGAMWKKRYPDAPIPKIRYWVIMNEYLKAPTMIVQPKWLSIAMRSLKIATRSFTELTLRHLFLFAEVNRLRGDGECEVRWVAVPPTWMPPDPDAAHFNADTMRSLSDLGRRMGADPNSWHAESP